jgi:pyruvate/2-oxoglutarate dehydrogenase complex dihydrolipoamide dehydrogenase (E3) component
VIVVGSGSGATIVENALAQGWSVALIDHGPLGGTCLNVGCIPSKILVYPADQIMAIREAAKPGVHAEITEVAFGEIMDRMRRIIDHDVQQIREGVRSAAGLDYYDQTAHFVDEHTLQVDETTIRAERIYLSSGSRPQMAPIESLEEISYLTNESVLSLQDRPESLLIVGGGYIGAEYAHFFEAMGTAVTLVQRNEHLVPEEEPEIQALVGRFLGDLDLVLIEGWAQHAGPKIEVLPADKEGRLREPRVKPPELLAVVLSPGVKAEEGELARLGLRLARGAGEEASGAPCFLWHEVAALAEWISRWQDGDTGS